MNTSSKSPWQFPVTRSGLTVVLIYNIVIAYFYYAWVWSDGKQGLPPTDTLVLLAGADGVIALFFCLELVAAMSRWFWGNLNEHFKFLYKGLGIFVLSALGYSWLLNVTDPVTKGVLVISEGKTVDYTFHKHDQSVHYYARPRDSRDGIALTILCTEGSSHDLQKSYVRCLHQKPGTVMGRPPMRAPGSWVTSPLTQTDIQVLTELKERGVIK